MYHNCYILQHIYQGLIYLPFLSSGGDPEKFKACCVAHTILSDPEKRVCYDESGDVDDAQRDEMDEKSFEQWNAYFRRLYPKVCLVIVMSVPVSVSVSVSICPTNMLTRTRTPQQVTIEKISAFSQSYKGSDEESSDVLAEYTKRKGDMRVLMSCIMLAEEEDVPRFVELILKHIQQGVVPRFPAFVAFLKSNSSSGSEKGKQSGKRKGKGEGRKDNAMRMDADDTGDSCGSNNDDNGEEEEEEEEEEGEDSTLGGFLVPEKSTSSSLHIMNGQSSGSKGSGAKAKVAKGPGVLKKAVKAQPKPKNSTHAGAGAGADVDASAGAGAGAGADSAFASLAAKMQRNAANRERAFRDMAASITAGSGSGRGGNGKSKGKAAGAGAGAGTSGGAAANAATTNGAASAAGKPKASGKKGQADAYDIDDSVFAALQAKMLQRKS